MAMQVEGKTAIITGAGSGINLCFAKILLEKGCNVVFADLTLRPEAQALMAEYPMASAAAKAVFQKTDVTDWAQLDRMFAVANEHFGGAEIVCPGAGVYEPVSSSPGSFNVDAEEIWLRSLSQTSGTPQALQPLATASPPPDTPSSISISHTPSASRKWRSRISSHKGSQAWWYTSPASQAKYHSSQHQSTLHPSTQSMD
jgi:short chain dehydrogenase